MPLNLSRILVGSLLLLGLNGARAQTPPPFQDQKAWPETPAAQRAKAVLEALNSGQLVQFRTFLEKAGAPAFLEAPPLNEHLSLWMDVYQSSQGYDFYGVRTYDPLRPDNTVIVIVRNRLTESWDAIVVEVETAEPHRLTGLQFTQARTPKDVPAAGPLTEAEAVQQARDYMEKLNKVGLFSGTALLARDGKVLYEAAYGEADLGFHVPNRLDTLFNLGSMNKMFTAVAVAQLVEQGKLSFDDPVSKWLGPEWLKKEYADAIQVKHLLSHTSGLGSYFNETWDKASRALYRTVEDYKTLVADEVPAFAPGQGWKYSNTGFLIAGAIVQKASGQDYFEYVRKNIYQPAGMLRSDSYAMDEPVENLAVGYFRQAGPGGPRWKNNLFLHVIQGGPAGGGYSTVGDLLRFDQALRSGKLVRKETAELLWTAKPELGSAEYGYGFGVRELNGNRLVGHGGGFAGINGELEMDLGRGYTIAVLTNRDFMASRVAEKFRELLGRVQTK